MRGRRGDHGQWRRATSAFGQAHDRLWQIEDAEASKLVRDHASSCTDDRDRLYGFARGSEWYDDDE